MEVLHSTDVIGEEIKEEARKKADRILKNADMEIQALKKALAERLEKLEEEEKKIYSDKIQKYRESVFVTLPLKKWKEKVEYVENTLNNALEAYFTSLSLDKKLKIIKTMLERFEPKVRGESIIVEYAGFEKNEVEKLISSIFFNSTIKEYKEATYAQKRFAGVSEGIIIEDVEKTFICKAGMEQAKKNIFDEKKEMLAKELFGESLS